MSISFASVSVKSRKSMLHVLLKGINKTRVFFLNNNSLNDLNRLMFNRCSIYNRCEAFICTNSNTYIVFVLPALYNMKFK